MKKRIAKELTWLGIIFIVPSIASIVSLLSKNNLPPVDINFHDTYVVFDHPLSLIWLFFALIAIVVYTVKIFINRFNSTWINIFLIAVFGFVIYEFAGLIHLLGVLKGLKTETSKTPLPTSTFRMYYWVGYALQIIFILFVIYLGARTWIKIKRSH
jgi:hypothetical protein